MGGRAQHEASSHEVHRARMRLLPYIYAGMEKRRAHGVPLMRPMFHGVP